MARQPSSLSDRCKRVPERILPREAFDAPLSSERAAGELTVKAVHLEPGVRRSGAFDDGLDCALDRLRDPAGLERVRR